MGRPFPTDIVERAITGQTGEGPLADALRGVGRGVATALANAGGLFIYQPGGVTSGNTFADWAALNAALTEPSPVLIDDDFVSPAPIPAGVWDKITDLDGEFNSGHPGGQVRALCLDGCKLPNLGLVSAQLLLGSSSTSSVLTMGENSVLYLDLGAGLVCTPGSAPMIDIAPGLVTQATIIMDFGSTLGDGTNPVISVGAGGNGCQIIDDDIGGLANNAIVGPGACRVLVTSASALIRGTPPPLEPGVAIFQVQNLSTTNNGNNWSATSLASLVANTNLQAAGPSTSQAIGIRPLVNTLWTTLLVTHDGDAGNPPNSTVTYQLKINGAPVVGASVTLNAQNAGQSGFASFLAGIGAGGGLVTLQAQPSAGVVNTPTSIVGALV